MRVFINVKQIGKKNNYLTKEEYAFKNECNTLIDLIKDIVTTNVKKYNNKQHQQNISVYLIDSDIEKKAKVGKIGFGFLYNKKKAVLENAIQTAIQAFEDGIYRVFINDEEIVSLDEEIKVHEGDVITFIRLVMLAGRLG